jgi:hypothetical protein
LKTPALIHPPDPDPGKQIFPVDQISFQCQLKLLKMRNVNSAPYLLMLVYLPTQQMTDIGGKQAAER